MSSPCVVIYLWRERWVWRTSCLLDKLKTETVHVNLFPFFLQQVTKKFCGVLLWLLLLNGTDTKRGPCSGKAQLWLKVNVNLLKWKLRYWRSHFIIALSSILHARVFTRIRYDTLDCCFQIPPNVSIIQNSKQVKVLCILYKGLPLAHKQSVVSVWRKFAFQDAYRWRDLITKRGQRRTWKSWDIVTHIRNKAF